MRKHCIGIATAMLLAGCAGNVPEADTSRITAPPAAWMTPPVELKPIPKCDGAPDPIKCRADYDIPERTTHATTASHLRNLQNWVRKLLRKKTPS